VTDEHPQMPEWARQLAQMHSSDGLVRPDLELSCFGGLTPLTNGDGWHEVFRATLPDGRARALKEYPAAQYNVLLKEARLLRKLRHPYIVEVRRNHPAARHGSSTGWRRAGGVGCVESRQPQGVPGAAAVRRRVAGGDHARVAAERRAALQGARAAGACRISALSQAEPFVSHCALGARGCGGCGGGGQIALALEYIHSSGVIHLDVKPSNIFLAGTGPDEQIKLGDFDVSATAVTTLSSSSAAVSGFTPEYAAPEVLQSPRATAAADIFSLGLVLLDIQLALRGKTSAARPKPPFSAAALRPALAGPPPASDELVALLAATLADDPKQRPSAALVLAHKYFADDGRALAAQEEKRKGPELACAICLSRTPAAGGLGCPKQQSEHFLCDECLAGKVVADCRLNDDNDLILRGARVFCVGRTLKGSVCCGAGAVPYADADLARHVPPDAFQQYMAARHEVVAAQLSREKDEAVRRAVEAELERLQRQVTCALARGRPCCRVSPAWRARVVAA
jgi:hypothetical protein